MMTSGLPDCMTFSSSGSRSLTERDLGVGDEDVGVLEDGLHALGVGDEVGGDVALVEAHALGELELEAEGVALLDGDDAFLADLVHRLGDELADLRCRPAEMDAVAAICSLVSTSLAMASSSSLTASTAFSMPRLRRHRVGAGGHVAQALADERLGEHGRGGGAVTGDVVGLLGDLLDELGADLLVRVLELDLLGDGDTVVGDRGGAPLLLQDDVAALRAEGDLDGVGEDVHAALEAATGLLVERDDLCHGGCSSRNVRAELSLSGVEC